MHTLRLDEEEASDEGGSSPEGDSKTPYEVIRDKLGLPTVRETVTTVTKKATRAATPDGKHRGSSVHSSLSGLSSQGVNSTVSWPATRYFPWGPRLPSVPIGRIKSPAIS